MAQPSNILIFGGTGLIGKIITGAILASKQSFGKVAIFTSPSTIESKKELLDGWKTQGLEVVVGDVTKDEDVLDAYKTYDTIISAVGRNALAHQIKLIKLAEETPNVTRFFPSEYGTDIEYNSSSINEKPHQLKLKTRAYIKEHVKRLEHTYLVTGPYAELYFGKSDNADYGSFDVKNKTATLLGTGDDPVSFTTMPDVGTLLVAALLHPNESRDKALRVNSYTTTPRQILHEYEKQTGGQQWKVDYTPLSELKKLEAKAWDEGIPSATVYTLRRIWTEGGTLYKERDNGVIGDPEVETLEKTVAKLVKQVEA